MIDSLSLVLSASFIPAPPADAVLRVSRAAASNGE